MQTSQGQHRHKHHRDNEGGEDHRAADFQRGVEHDREGRTWHSKGLVLLQPAENILHVDDGVVHHFADGNGESPERHGVQRDAEFLQHNDSSEQRQRNRRDGNKRGAKVAEEQEQHHRDEDAAEPE